eukprot:SAG25_NODE_598_length_6649_cov_3.644427_2_plen_176_part_00
MRTKLRSELRAAPRLSSRAHGALTHCRRGRSSSILSKSLAGRRIDGSTRPVWSDRTGTRALGASGCAGGRGARDRALVRHINIDMGIQARTVLAGIHPRIFLFMSRNFLAATTSWSWHSRRVHGSSSSAVPTASSAAASAAPRPSPRRSWRHASRTTSWRRVSWCVVAASVRRLP